MNLKQLHYICEIARREDLSISAVADALHTNQPGISKQLKLLEDELGIEIFERSRNRLAGITADGKRILEHAHAILGEVHCIKEIGSQHLHDNAGPLVIAVTHTQARYVLPGVVKRFAERYPDVSITMRHADPERIAQMVISGDADIGVTTNDPPELVELAFLPVREFARLVIVPREHPLVAVERLTLEELAKYPLVTYEPAFTSREVVLDAFEAAGLDIRIVIGAIDGNVIKTCVEKGLGYAVLSEVAFDAERDINLRALRADHLFPPSTTKIWLSRQRYIRRYIYEFIEMCSPRWTRSAVQQLVRDGSRRRARRTPA